MPAKPKQIAHDHIPDTPPPTENVVDQAAPDELIPDTDQDTTNLPFEISDYATGAARVAARVPDHIADLLEDLRAAHGREIRTQDGKIIPAGAVKFRTVTAVNPEASHQFVRHVLNYSRNELNPTHSARLTRLSATQVRVGVAPRTPRPRATKPAGTTDAPKET